MCPPKILELLFEVFEFLFAELRQCFAFPRIGGNECCQAADGADSAIFQEVNIRRRKLEKGTNRVVLPIRSTLQWTIQERRFFRIGRGNNQPPLVDSQSERGRQCKNGINNRLRCRLLFVTVR